MTDAELEGAGTHLDEFIADPASLTGQETWERLGMEEHRGTVLAVLFSRRRSILDRLVRMRMNEALSTVHERANGLQDADDRAAVAGVIRRLEAVVADVEGRRAELERTQQAAETGARIAEDPLLRVHLFERRSEVWTRFLAKESVATIVGAVLLTGLAAVVVAAMFTDTPVTDTVTNSFLILLGYFFGHSLTSRHQSRSGQHRTG
ncbi:hypothetical protein [Micromonospora vulcania]|uniref:Uncharacterized protein n=1 Tax=Micromonospora vulcania TaxID=1441873 RepID=A0ABW1HFU0_9ACTN